MPIHLAISVHNQLVQATSAPPYERVVFQLLDAKKKSRLIDDPQSYLRRTLELAILGGTGMTHEVKRKGIVPAFGVNSPGINLHWHMTNLAMARITPGSSLAHLAGVPENEVGRAGVRSPVG